MVRHGSSSRGTGGDRRRSGSRGRGLPRDARGGQEGGPRAGSAARNAALCRLPTRLGRVHVCPGTATKAAWTATEMSAPDKTPPLAAATSALVMAASSASALVSGRSTREVLAAEEQRDVTCFSLWEAWQRRGCRQGQYRMMMRAVGVLYGHLLGAQRALAAAAAAAPLVLRKDGLCEMEVA